MPEADVSSVVFAVCLGIGLAAAAGFRVFVAPLVLAVAVSLDAPGVAAVPDWLGTWPALLVLGSASVLELGAYYVPWLDNALDSVASPAAVLAGVLLAAGVLSDMHPVAQWGIAIVAGGGAAGVTQSATVLTRALSSLTTGGLANFLVASGEVVAALTLAILALVFAPLAAVLFLGACFWLVLLLRQRRARRSQENSLQPQPAVRR